MEYSKLVLASKSCDNPRNSAIENYYVIKVKCRLECDAI
jgi:hypothetical protein